MLDQALDSGKVQGVLVGKRRNHRRNDATDRLRKVTTN